VNFLVLALAWRRRHGRLGGVGIVAQLGRALAAPAVLGVVAWASERGLAAQLGAGGGLERQLALGLLPVAAGGLAYLAAARALGIAELTELAGALRRRRARR
jgi:putative peptidoglycan lipid II flippase